MGFLKKERQNYKRIAPKPLKFEAISNDNGMKRRFGNLLVSVIVGSGILFAGCKKEKTPDYPDLIGYWQGQTSQGNPISFKVENKKGTLYITQYNLLVTFGSGQQTFQHTNTAGIAALSGLYFTVPLGTTGTSGPAFIDGNFDYGATTITLTGTFAVYYPGSTVDMVTGNYTAYKY